jgi:hypothetical protein
VPNWYKHMSSSFKTTSRLQKMVISSWKISLIFLPKKSGRHWTNSTRRKLRLCTRIWESWIVRPSWPTVKN